MNRAFWILLFTAIGVFGVSVLVAPLSFAPISIFGVYLEPLTLFAGLILCPILYIATSIKARRLRISGLVTFIGFYGFVFFIFPWLFHSWLNTSFSPLKGYSWRGQNGSLYYISDQDPGIGDAQYAGQAWINPPWVQAP